VRKGTWERMDISFISDGEGVFPSYLLRRERLKGAITALEGKIGGKWKPIRTTRVPVSDWCVQKVRKKSERVQL